MEKIVEKLQELARASAPLEPNENQRDAYAKQIKQFVEKFLGNIEQGKSFVKGHPSEAAFALKEEPQSMEQLMDIYQKEVVELGINPASGGHLGYIPGGGIFTSALGDYIADISNEYAGMYYGSPGAVAMENELLNWLKEIFGFPISAIGNLTSGGSIANLIALTAARDHHKIKGALIEKSVIYTSPQVHHCIQKALRIIGLADVQIRYLELDALHRIDALTLTQAIADDKAKGLNPFLVIASAGTTDTGAIDPLLTIGELAKKEGLWYHVDAAYGGFFILVEEKKKAFAGIELSDSLVIDPHKGLFLPYGTGAVLVKNKEAVFASHHYTANYMQDATRDGSLVNPADVSPELTKHFRGMRLWLPLQLHGLAPFVACLEEKLWLTKYFRLRLQQIGFAVGPEPDLSVSYFWYPLANGNLESENNFNEKLLNRLHDNGDVFVSSTMLNGRYVIRMAILAFRTKKATIDSAMKMIEQEMKALV